jgi:cob(I)alamin adenosyltransferase
MESAKRLEPELELIISGKGFVGIIDDKSPREDHIKIAKQALRISKEKIQSGAYKIVILDEVNYAINLGLIDVKDVLELVKSKPEDLNLVLTGNHAKQEIIDLADLVTEMKEIKHPYKSGIKAKKGIDF